MPHGLLAELRMHTGDSAAAVEHARTALPVMRRLGAGDDELQLRNLLVFCAIGEGRLADAADELGRMDQIAESATAFGSAVFRQICRAELLLASGDFRAGLEMYREGAARMREIQLPGVTHTGMEPWVLFGEAMALNAHARYAAGDDVAHGEALFRVCRTGTLRVMTPENPRLDYPASGLLLFALGAWSLLRQAGPAEDALRLLALARRFAYNRMVPTMRWERIIAPAQEAAPGLLARLRAEYRDTPPPPGLLARGPAGGGAAARLGSARVRSARVRSAQRDRRGQICRARRDLGPTCAAGSCAPTAARIRRRPRGRPAASSRPRC